VCVRVFSMQKEKVICLGLCVDEFVVKYPFNPSGRVLYDHVFSIMFCSKSASSRQKSLTFRLPLNALITLTTIALCCSHEIHKEHINFIKKETILSSFVRKWVLIILQSKLHKLCLHREFEREKTGILLECAL